MRFLTCTRALYTEKTAHRVIHGQFVNAKGGEGNNYPNDLKMEHIVRNNKAILKGLCGNKTIKAVERCSKAAHGLQKILQQFDTVCNITPDSSRHTHTCTTDDVQKMLGVIHKARPFQHQAGRKLHSFPNIKTTPLDKLNVPLLYSWLTNHKKHLFADINYTEDMEESEEDEEDPEEDNDESDVNDL